MARKERILAAVNLGEDAHPAMLRALELGRALNMAVDLFTAVYKPDLIGERFFAPDRLRAERRKAVDECLDALDELLAAHARPGDDVRLCAAWDKPVYEALIREALRIDARYVIIGAHYHAGLARFLFTNTDWQMIRECPVPLWIARSEQKAIDRPQIVAAVDPMHAHDKPADFDTRIMSEAMELTDRLEGTGHVMHVFNPFSSPDDPARVEATHAARLQELTDGFQVPAERVRLLSGDTGEVLPRAARELEADIVVMGAVARSRLDHAALGSTAERVIDLMPCDVLILKPKQFTGQVIFDSEPESAIHVERCRDPAGS